VDAFESGIVGAIINGRINPSVEFAHLRPADLDTFLEQLWVPAQQETAAFGPHTLLNPELVRAEGETHVSARIDDNESVIFVARDDAVPVGYAAAEVQTPPPIFEQHRVCHVNELFVRPSARRQGVGMRLLAAIEAWAVDTECPRLTLTVDSDNQPARALYAAAGYKSSRHTMHKPVDPEQ
jgi:Acetyltransferases